MRYSVWPVANTSRTDDPAENLVAPEPRRRAAFVVPNMRVGGMQRVTISLIRAFLASGWKVDVVLVKREGEFLGEIPGECRLIDLSASRLRNVLFRLSRYLRLNAPDLVVPSVWPLTTIAILSSRLARFRGVVLACEHSTMSLTPVGTGLNGLILRSSMRWLNSRFATVVAVSEGVRQDLIALGAAPGRVKTIHNPVDPVGNVSGVDNSLLPVVWQPRPKRLRLLAVGRLKDAKDYPMMLEAMRLVLDRGIDAGLVIVGDGGLRPSLVEHIDRLGLQGNVELAGAALDPREYYSGAGMFLLSSKFEGFGNVLVEAMSCGVPVVSTDCRSGPREILDGGLYGRLVPVGNARDFADAIVGTLGEVPNSEALRNRARDFIPAVIARRYIELFETELAALKQK